MTTICYNHKDKEIAVDSRSTRGNLIDSDSDNKFSKVNGVTFALCGATCDYELLFSYYFGSPVADLVPECKAIVVDGGVAYEFYVNSEGNPCKDMLVSNTAFGTGGDFALAAMDFGCNARNAVKYAMTRDSKSGGKIRVMKVK